jgi:hypothetical protein
MRNFSVLIFLIFFGISANAQSQTTNNLQKKYEKAFSLYFYKNTLRMLNQENSKEFDEAIKNIEKMKFLMVDKEVSKFTRQDYKKLLIAYGAEAYEEVMTSRFEGKNFDVYLKDQKGMALGTVMLVSDSSKLYVLDIIGTIDVSKASKFFSTLNESSELGQRVKSFMSKDDKDKRKTKEVVVD